MSFGVVAESIEARPVASVWPSAMKVAMACVAVVDWPTAVGALGSSHVVIAERAVIQPAVSVLSDLYAAS
jgi:hypothetical protein